jgi:hypothetical protein
MSWYLKNSGSWYLKNTNLSISARHNIRSSASAKKVFTDVIRMTYRVVVLSVSYIYNTSVCSIFSKILFLRKDSFLFFLFRYTEIMLFCLVLGEKFSDRFEISINTEKTVSAVQDFIKGKKENTLKNIYANNLNLWKVAIPTKIENNKRKILESKPHDQIDIEKDLEGVLLEADDNIDDLFDQQPEIKQISIIVKPPPPPATTGKCLPMVYLSNKKFQLSFVDIFAFSPSYFFFHTRNNEEEEEDG